MYQEKQENLVVDVFTVEKIKIHPFSLDFPSSNLFAIKYVDFSVYILARVPYLVGKQNTEYVRRSSAEKKDFAF